MTRELEREFLVELSVLTEAEEIRLYHAVSQAKQAESVTQFENACAGGGAGSNNQRLLDKVLVMVEDQPA